MWFWHSVSAYSTGYRIRAANAADIPKGDKDRSQKNDECDARSISQELSTKKDLKHLYVPTPAWERARTLARNRQQQLSDST
ncbi:MAG: hypothetical protein H7X79_03720, partial [Sporomusaceae bacterium]|nr:hypothetical protein [Sporomusaceae bacterium]